MPATDVPDPEFTVLRESICQNLHAMQRGLAVETMFQHGEWDETRFWDRFIEQTRLGAFDGYLRQWNGEQLPEMWALYRPHFEGGRFDDLIRNWANAAFS